MSREHGPEVVVVGAGIVGVCCALYLQRDGCDVTLIDRQGPGEGASYGNGSVLSAEAVVPVQTPGMLRQVPGMLLDPLGPLTIRWHYLPRLLPWLVRFLAASRWSRVEEVSVALARLLRGEIDDYAPLLELAGAEAMLRRTGWFCVYESEADFRRARPLIELRRRRGIEFEILDAAQLTEREPALAPVFPRAIYYPAVAYATDVFRMVQVLAEAFVREGGRLRREEAQGFEFGGPAGGTDGVRTVLTAEGRHSCEAVVVAAGAWSRALARQLGSDPPLDTERGYHVHMPDPGVMPRVPIYSTDRAIVCTPLEHGLRVAGTVELGGLDAAPDWRRAEVLLTHARRWFPGLNVDGAQRWMGFRPSMPDSLPVVSASPRHANAFFAFGHGHSGVGMGARTGRLIADLVAGRDPGIDMTPYRIDRF